MKTCISIYDCPQEKVLLFTKNGYDVVECKACGHRFSKPDAIETHLHNVYSDSYFFEGKDGYPNYLDEKDILIKHGDRYAKIVSNYINVPGSLLDVGCAAGFILKGFKQNGWQCYGIEPNKTMAAYGKTELDVDIQVGSLESVDMDKTFDLITLIQVIGHFQDIDKALKNANKLLNPGGYVLVESWNRDSLMSKLMGKNWHEYSPPSVIHWFSDKTLINLFKFHGFTFIAKGLPLKQINLKHAISLVDGKTPNFALKHKLINGLEKSIGNLKVIYPPVDLKWYIFQK